VLQAPPDGGGDGFAALLGEVAAAVDAGRTAGEALAAAAAAVGAVRPTPER
jgi:hypothetical protein